jgi:phosphoglycerol transferase MdoB-like AlkP superfamily enzyme
MVKDESVETQSDIKKPFDIKKQGKKFCKYINQKFNITTMRNLVYPMIFFVGMLLYFEIVTHLFIYNSIDSKIIFPIIFAFPVGLIFTILSGFFDKFVNTLIIWIIATLSYIIFALQLVYYNVFKVFFSFQSLGMAGEAMSEFGEDFNNAIRSNIIPMILLFLPLLVLYFLIKKVFLNVKRRIKIQGFLLVGAIFVQILGLLLLPIFGKSDHTPYELYYDSRVPELSAQQLGVITLTRFDFAGIIRGNEELVLVEKEAISHEIIKEENQDPTTTDPSDLNEPSTSTEPKPTPATDPSKESNPNEQPDTKPTAIPTIIPIDRSPNIIEIDFEDLAENEKNKDIRTLHSYFSSVAATNKNEYTGKFEGYNLIMITAEGFSPYAVHKELTPTLYKLTNEGFIFNNFYTALWQTSTSDGEYTAMTSLIPVGARSMYLSRKNLMPFALGNQFNCIGIESKAYHNHTYTYYERDKTHPNLGYDFKAKGNGLILDSDVWPGSDLEMVRNTVDEYIQEEPFHIYYLTVSGHMNYTFVGNSMSFKNKDLVKDLPYSSDVRAYLACQIEFDRALEELINRLSDAGIADKTVIAISADHYPYGWDREKLEELAGHEIESNFDIYRNHFILWNPGMTEKIIIDKPASSLDIIPTLSNLFGLKYDSRLLMGQDILSDSEPLVILSNRSFITDKVKYNSSTGEVINLTNEELAEDYVKNINGIIKNKFTVSKSVLKNDYYRYVFPDYPKEFMSEGE